MDFLTLAQQRYTTKKYNPAKTIAPDDIDRLKEILRLSPSSINSQPWMFLFVSNEAVKAKLAEVSYANEQRVLDAQYIVVFTVLDDLALLEQHIQKASAHAITYYRDAIKTQSDEQIKAWLAHQVYISLGFFLSACAAMGIDSTPMEGIAKDAYRDLLDVQDYKVLFAVAIGQRKSDDDNQPSITPKTRLPREDIIRTYE